MTNSAKPSDTPKTDTTHFGYKDVPVNQKQNLVAEVFQSVAGKYDLMNDATVSYTHLTLPTIYSV